jgi:competence protein ComGD
LGGKSSNAEKKMLKSRKYPRGFTLLEIMIVIFILSVLLGTAWTSFFHAAHKYRLQRAIWEIHSRMNYSRFKAVIRGTKFRMSFHPNGYTVESFDQNANSWKTELGSLLEGVQVEANNSPIFHPEGTVSNLVTITVSNTWGSYKMTLAISGRIKTVKLYK